VAVRELEPRPGERIGDLVGMLVEAPGNLLVVGIHPQRQVRDQHGRRMTLRRVEGIRNRGGSALRPELIGPSRALLQLPFIFEQVFKKVVPHFVGVVLQVTSGPPVIASLPLPVPNLLFQPRPCSSISAASGSGPTSAASPAPWVLPKLCPPAMSATVGSSFIAMRLKVSRMSTAAATGSGLKFGPFGFT